MTDGSSSEAISDKFDRHSPLTSGIPHFSRHICSLVNGKFHEYSLGNSNYGGMPFTTIYSEAIIELKRRLASGELYAKAIEVEKWNGRRSHYSFEQFNTLHKGWFETIFEHPAFTEVRGPELSDHGLYAKAGINLPRIIWFNPYTHTQMAERLSNVFPTNETGWDRLKWVAASTMIHEMMHIVGTRHPAEVDYGRGSDYASSLAYVAERALCMCSPHWSVFGDLYDNNQFLSGPGVRRTCGCG